MYRKSPKLLGHVKTKSCSNIVLIRFLIFISTFKGSRLDFYLIYMEKPKRLPQIIAFSFAIMLIALLLFGIYYAEQNKPTKLYPGEIQNYQGQDLSSIADFRENSIRGPQTVSLANHGLSEQNSRVHVRGGSG